MGKSGGEQQRGRLTQNAADGKDAAGDDSVHAVGKHHRADDPPLSRAQTERALPVALGHGFQAFLRVAHDGGQIHDDKGQRASQQGSAHIVGKQKHTHKAVDDGGNTGEGLGGVLNDRDDLFIVGVLRQVDRRANAKGKHQNQGVDDDVQGIEDVRQNADAVGKVAGLGAEQLPCDVGNTLRQNVDHEKQGQSGGQRGGKIHPAPNRPEKQLSFFGNHFALSPFRKKFRAALMSMMNRNSTSAMENSACFCRPLE